MTDGTKDLSEEVWIQSNLNFFLFLSVIISINTVINEHDCEKLHELNKNALYGGRGKYTQL